MIFIPTAPIAMTDQTSSELEAATHLLEAIKTARPSALVVWLLVLALQPLRRLLGT